MSQPSPSSLAAQQDRLLALISECGSCAVAFSGGVDSAVVAKAAQLALGDQAVAVTASSPSLAAGELDEARRVAEFIGIRHEVVATSEFEKPAYLRNAPDRCYHCKDELYSRLDEMLERLGVVTMLNGANLDDAGDYRPGMQAAAEHRVRSPLLECGLRKDGVRALARQWELPVWDKPAAPCLASRVAYGEEVTPQRLRMIDRGEQFLRSRGFQVVRVRYHRGELARIELPAEELSRLADPALMAEVVAELRDLGFRFVTLDLQGFRSGSLNTLIQLSSPES